MPEYIEREAALEAFGEEPLIWIDAEAEIQEHSDWLQYRNIVKSQPAADVAPVRYGRWIHRKNWDKWVCGKCSSEEPKPSNYYPECGARMDEEERAKNAITELHHKG